MAHHPRYPAAFTEGRRLRHRSERRRSGHRRLPSRNEVLGVLLLLMVATGGPLFLAISLMVAGMVIMGVFMMAAPLLLVGTMGFVAIRRRRRLARTAGTAPLPARPAARRDPERVWTLARDRFHTLAAAYAAHECDPMNVLRLPALSDVTVPSTGRFVDAFAEAQALESDRFPGEEHAASFVRAVDLAERAWRAAREAADRIRLSGLSPAERSTVERVIKLLTVARDSASEPERLAAYTRARTELTRLDAAGVIHLPRTAAAALDTAARGSLPA